MRNQSDVRLLVQSRLVLPKSRACCQSEEVACSDPSTSIDNKPLCGGFTCSTVMRRRCEETISGQNNNNLSDEGVKPGKHGEAVIVSSLYSFNSKQKLAVHAN